jgi:acyl dehydratase
MPLDELVGSTYGPFPARVSAEQVAAYVAVTGDDSSRWTDYAPPTFAGALLFVAAPSFLYAETVKPYTKLLVHADQSFAWHRPLEIDEWLTVDGVLERLRSRAGTKFITFKSSVRSGDEVVIEATSTFLMGDGPPPADPEDEVEPPIADRGAYDELPVGLAPEPGPLPEMARSASRLDLVRYAAASGDFNPVHFDQETARRAGFPGVLVHGLLMGAWLVQLAAAHSPRPDPIAFAKLRFRNPLRAAVEANVGGVVQEVGDGEADLRLALRAGATEYVDARVRVRMA